MNQKRLFILLGLVVAIIALGFFVDPTSFLGLPVIGMALGKDRSRINVRGGGDLYIRELKPTATDAFSQLGIIEKFEIVPDFGMMDIPDAEGNILDFLAGQKRFGINITLAQSSKDELDFIHNASGKYYDMLYNVPMEDGTTQQWSFCLVKFEPGSPLSFAGSTKRSPMLKGVALAPKAAFTRTPTTFNIVKNTPFVLYQNASPAATPSDTAATMATAII